MTKREPDQAPVEESTQSEPLGDDGERVDQQNVGFGVERGGGEFPDPDTPPSDSAPGEPGVSSEPHGGGQFAEAYEAERRRDGGAT
jgi:hypothetical protein